MFDIASLNIVESNSKVIKLCKSHFQLSNAWYDLKDVPFGSMDLILVSHVLEHIQGTEIDTFLSNLKNILDDDRIAVLEVPNNDFRDHDIRSSLSQDVPHTSFFSTQSLIKLCKKVGLEILFINTVGKTVHSLHQDPCPKKHKKTPFLYLKHLLFKLGLLDKIKLLSGKNKNLYKSSDFHYGGKRACIRLVCKKQKAG